MITFASYPQKIAKMKNASENIPFIKAKRPMLDSDLKALGYIYF